MGMWYRLEGHDPVPVNSWDAAFGAWFDTGDNRRVATTDIGAAHVSTVFLGLDHNSTGEGGPILFETLVFGGALDEEMARYRTWDEAVAGHAEMCARVRQAGTAEGRHG